MLSRLTACSDTSWLENVHCSQPQSVHKCLCTTTGLPRRYYRNLFVPYVYVLVVDVNVSVMRAVRAVSTQQTTTVRTSITMVGWGGGSAVSWTRHVISTLHSSHSTRRPVASCSRAGRTVRRSSTSTTRLTTFILMDSTMTVRSKRSLRLVSM